MSEPTEAGPMRWSHDAMVAWAVAPNPGPLTLDGTRSYRVGRRAAILVDPGPAIDGQIALLRGLLGDMRVEAICLTHAHRDHAGAAAEASRVFGAPLMASAATLKRTRLSGRVLGDGDSVEADEGAMRLTVHEAPGHSADHLVYFLTPQRLLFSGDLVLGTGSSAVLHPDGDVGACLRSLDRLLELAPFSIYPGHGPVVEDGAGRVRAYREHRLARHAQVERALHEGARSVATIRRTVYGRIEPGLTGAADASIRAHLARLRETGVDIPPVTGFDDTHPAPEEA
jgi:glyoxylase-like metal-dependent hydrolase (beta-lactamase superfamily II)